MAPQKAKIEGVSYEAAFVMFQSITVPALITLRAAQREAGEIPYL